MKLDLTPKEKGILDLLKENRGQVCSIDYIYESVWKQIPFDCSDIVMVHIRHLREKVEENPSHPRYIKTIHGEGYCYFE